MKSNEQALCHSVSSDLKMSQGLAKKFTHRFRTLGSVRQYHNTLQPRSIVTHCSIEQEKLIYNLVPKYQFFDKPTYTDLSQSLKRLKAYMLQKKVQ